MGNCSVVAAMLLNCLDSVAATISSPLLSRHRPCARRGFFFHLADHACDCTAHSSMLFQKRLLFPVQSNRALLQGRIEVDGEFQLIGDGPFPNAKLGG